MSAGLLLLVPLRVEAAAVASGAPGATVVRTGMGQAAAAATAARLAAAVPPSPRPGPGAPVRTGPARPAAGPDAVVVTGVAGALVPGLAAGDLVVADRILDGAGCLVAELAGAGLLAGAMRRAGLVVHVGPIASTERAVRDDAGRVRLAGHGAIAVDMESAALLARPWRVPTAVVRAVADGPGHRLVSARTVTAGLAALRSLRAAGPTLESWAAAAGARRVVVAGPRSFCAGVERAIDTVLAGLERYGAPLYVRRAIVHNEHVVADLAGRGAVFVEEFDEVPVGAHVVISAHGVSPAVRAAAEARGLAVIDATCPLVSKVHAEVRRFAARGREIVLIGHAGHDEVEGTLGEAPGIHLVSGPGDVAALDLDAATPVAYATQTTLATGDVARTVTALAERYPDLVGPPASDICYATQNRQEAVASVAADCEVTLVVGSATSSNANRLVELAGSVGSRAHLVADETAVDPAWLAGARTVGLTAAASTPETLVTRVLAALASLGPLEIERRDLTAERVTFPLPLEVR